MYYSKIGDGHIGAVNIDNSSIHTIIFPPRTFATPVQFDFYRGEDSIIFVGEYTNGRVMLANSQTQEVRVFLSGLSFSGDSLTLSNEGTQLFVSGTSNSDTARSSGLIYSAPTGPTCRQPQLEAEEPFDCTEADFTLVDLTRSCSDSSEDFFNQSNCTEDLCCSGCGVGRIVGTLDDSSMITSCETCG